MNKFDHTFLQVNDHYSFSSYPSLNRLRAAFRKRLLLYLRQTFTKRKILLHLIVLSFEVHLFF